MKFSTEFKFLNVQSVKRKNAEELKPEEQYFYIINLLDEENNPVRFFSFDNKLNSEIVKSINNQQLKGLQNCLVDYELNYSNNNWNVRLVDLKTKF